MKYTIKNPKMMGDIHTARYNPNIIISILIAIVIYIAYIFITLIAGMIYGAINIAQNPEITQGSYNEIVEKMTDVSSSQDVFLLSLFLMVFVILFVIIEVCFIEKRPLPTIGLSRKRFIVKYLMGFGVGALLIAVHMAPSFITEWNNIAYNGFSPLVLIFLLAFIIQTASEEIMFRGYLLSSFGHKIGTSWAVILSSLLFALFHLINGDATILGITSLFFIGLFLGFYMIRTNNLWGAFGIHAAWNFLAGCSSGIDIGPIAIDYSIISFSEATNNQDFGIVGDPTLLISIAIFMIGIAFVLFAGKNKIVKKVEFSVEEIEISNNH